ncbi:MAG: hypothetical protein K2W95_00575 [Candidatus Obscuribacterales bacterium]|nr:hypothetical protein [Candidatus Obscuribacterales bacterium]
MLNQEVSAPIQTLQLHQRLNSLYRQLRNTSSVPHRLQFDVLWDLKELALLEHRQSVDVPATWLDELENFARHKEETIAA